MKRNFRSKRILVALCAFMLGVLLYNAVALTRIERLNAALVQATYAGQEDKALALLKQGADPNLRFDPQTRKPLPANFWSRMAARLRNRTGNSAQSVPLLALTAAYDRKILASELLARGVDVDARDGVGSTPLMYAVDHNDRDILIDLLNAHANINGANRAGNTALHLAVAQKNAVHCALLLEHGANPNLANAQGQTPLDDVAALAADIHRDWLAAYIEALKPPPQKHPSRLASPPGSVILPSRPTPDMVTRLHPATA